MRAEDFGKSNIKEEHAQEKNISEKKSLALQESKHLGFRPREEKSHDLGPDKFKSENIQISSSSSQKTYLRINDITNEKINK